MPMMEEQKRIRLRSLLSELADPSQLKIYCDMDGVLCDFDRAFAEISDDEKNPVAYVRKHGDAEFWKVVNSGGESFWSDMKWKPDGKALWSYIKKHRPTILSAPGSKPESSSGKKKWLMKNVGNVHTILTKAVNKQKYAGPEAILIDDYKKNIDQWEAAGGIAIWHKTAAKTISELKKLGL